MPGVTVRTPAVVASLTGQAETAAILIDLRHVRSMSARHRASTRFALDSGGAIQRRVGHCDTAPPVEELPSPKRGVVAPSGDRRRHRVGWMLRPAPTDESPSPYVRERPGAIGTFPYGAK